MASQLIYTQRITAALSRISSLIVFILLVYIVISYWSGFEWSAEHEFNYHPPFMILALLVLPVQAVLIYRISPTHNHYTNKLIHTAIHSSSIILLITGLIAVIQSHNDNNIENWYSLHSWIGITTIILFSMNYTAGLITFLYPGLTQSIRKTLVPYHAFIGITVVCGSVCAIVTGLQERSTGRIQEGVNRTDTEITLINTAAIMTILTLVCILYALTSVNGHDKTRKINTHEDETRLLNNNDTFISYD